MRIAKLNLKSTDSSNILRIFYINNLFFRFYEKNTLYVDADDCIDTCD